MGLISFIMDQKAAMLMILRRPESIGKRMGLLLSYSRLVLRHVIFVKLLHSNIIQEGIFGFRVRFFNYGTFLVLFKEIFILRDYEFVANNSEPFIIDCGSNIGMSVLFFKSLYPKCSIVCFEPDSDTYRMLEQNIGVNNLQDVQPNNAAVYDKNGEISFYVNAQVKGALGMSVTKRMENSGVQVKEITVKSVKLSDYITKKVDLLKIDIEGAEGAVMKDLAKTDKLGLVNEIIMEYHNDMLGRNSLAELLTILEKAGFKYVIKSAKSAPYYVHANKPYKAMIYAYR